jgi:PTS system nitrogen regulatory IIA component
MDVSDFLAPHAVFPRAKAGSKKALLEFLAQKAAPLVALPFDIVFEAVWERERLSTTGVGQGIALPHGRLKGVTRPVGVFVRVEKPVDFESLDGLPVDLAFLLLTPEGAGADHLKALARISRLFRNQTVCEKLRGSKDASALYAILTEPAANLVAA